MSQKKNPSSYKLLISGILSQPQQDNQHREKSLEVLSVGSYQNAYYTKPEASLSSSLSYCVEMARSPYELFLEVYRWSSFVNVHVFVMVETVETTPINRSMDFKLSFLPKMRSFVWD